MSRLTNPELKEALQGSMDTNQGVQLPFVAPMMWWKNGQLELQSMKELTDPRRFGGWGISEEEVANASLELPASFRLFEMSGDNGNYNAYLSRGAYAAPICRRFTWFQIPDTGRWVSKLNVLAYMAGLNEKVLYPWGAVVITAKGYSGKYIDDAFKKFSVATAAMRDGDPPNYFYHPLGTWTQEPLFEKITGKGGSSSSITPCQLYTPAEGYKPEDLDKYFVGEEVAAEMSELYRQAQDWVHDWDKKEKQTVSDPNAAMVDAEQGEDEFPFLD